MNLFSFGCYCFNMPGSEQAVDLALSSKTEYNTFPDFIDAALHVFYKGHIENLRKDIINETASENDKKMLIKLLDGMNEKVEIQLEEIVNMVKVFELQWNEIVYAFETKYNYYFFAWYTTV